MKVINLWAGPGAGKSTLGAGLFHKMKSSGEKVELVTEYAKELVYESNPALANQLQILAEQDSRQRRLIGKVDYVVTDCPLPLTNIYAKPPFNQPWFINASWGAYLGYDNINIYVSRVKPYYEYGRYQTKDEAILLDTHVLDLMNVFDLPFKVIPGDTEGPERTYEYIKSLAA